MAELTGDKLVDVESKTVVEAVSEALSETSLETDPQTVSEPPDPLTENEKPSPSIWRSTFVVIPLIFILFLGVRLWQTNLYKQRASDEAPLFTVTTFEGETINLEDLRGQGVVLNFWASWCDPCRAEADLLEQTWRREQNQGIVFLGLDYLDQEPAALAYLEEYQVTYPNGPDLRSQVARNYRIKGVPETFFIDADGRIVEVIVGPLLNQGQLDALLDKIRPQ